jgi:hypothetical protein
VCAPLRPPPGTRLLAETPPATRAGRLSLSKSQKPVYKIPQITASDDAQITMMMMMMMMRTTTTTMTMTMMMTLMLMLMLMLMLLLLMMMMRL